MDFLSRSSTTIRKTLPLATSAAALHSKGVDSDQGEELHDESSLELSETQHSETQHSEEQPTEEDWSDGLSKVNIRNFSIKCGHCDTYQTLSHFQRREDWNVYTYECENEICDPAVTRTLVEVHVAVDEFANRDPTWRGGRIHAGAEDHTP